MVVHKDAGLLTVPAYDEECLVNRLEAELDRQRYGRFRLATVHRLDRETSGLLVFARTPPVAAHLCKQFAAHRVDREYVAIVGGTFEEPSGSINDRLEGKAAATHFTVLESYADSTKIAVRLGTGRRNQIRRHFAGLGHPVIGDTRFEPALARRAAWPHTRLALHARLLGFVHPVTKEALHFEANLPAAFDAFTAAQAKLVP